MAETPVRSGPLPPAADATPRTSRRLPEREALPTCGWPETLTPLRGDANLKGATVSATSSHVGGLDVRSCAQEPRLARRDAPLRRGHGPAAASEHARRDRRPGDVLARLEMV